MADDAPKTRIAFAVLTGLLVWLGVLFELGRWIAVAPSDPARNEPLEMRVVELEPSPVQRATPATHAAATRSPALKPPPEAPAQQQPRRHAPREQTTPTTRFHPDTQPQKSVPPSPSAPVAPDSRSTGNAPPHSAPTSDQSSTPAQASPSPGDAAAHSIAQPLPALPDDLREQSYQTVATARFTIHVDGSVDVELIKPTSNPRLNQILLEALHQWRFFPALQSGHPVESRQDIRVHFNVD
jgi:protein TonB